MITSKRLFSSPLRRCEIDTYRRSNLYKRKIKLIKMSPIINIRKCSPSLDAVVRWVVQSTSILHWYRIDRVLSMDSQYIRRHFSLADNPPTTLLDSQSHQEVFYASDHRTTVEWDTINHISTCVQLLTFKIMCEVLWLVELRKKLLYTEIILVFSPCVLYSLSALTVMGHKT